MIRELAAAPARAGSSVPTPGGASSTGAVRRSVSGRSNGGFAWFVILNMPQDLDELWRKIEHPDLVLMKGERADNAAALGAALAGKVADASRGLVESVKISGRVVGESADLVFELIVAVSGEGDVWVPIRLDNQRLVARARTGGIWTCASRSAGNGRYA